MARGKAAKPAEQPKPEQTEADQAPAAPADAAPAAAPADATAPAAAPADAAPAAPADAAPAAAPASDEAGPDNPASQSAEPEPIAEGDVTVIVAVGIGGTRNGEPWPAVGESFTLPAAEAAGYLQFGYVREVESAE